MFIFIILQLSVSETCKRYSCVYNALEKSTCAYYSKGEYFIHPCEDPQNPFCQQSATSNWTCTVPSAPESKYVSQKCTGSKECNDYSYQGCKNGVCKGFGSGDESENCQNSFYCQPGFYCKKDECSPQIALDSWGCITDYDCTNQGTCDGGLCRPYQQLAAGSELNSCNYEINYACESLMCRTDYFGKSYCIGKLSRDLRSPIECQDDTDCISNPDPESGIRSNPKCGCGYNPSGKKFCGLVTADEEYSKYLEALKKWRSSDSILKCNTMIRDDYRCIKDWWDYENAIRLMYYGEVVSKYSLIQETDYCAEVVLLKDFIDLKHRFEHIK